MKPMTFRQSFSRRRVLAGTAGLFSSAALAQKIASAQQPNANLGTPASVLTNPPRDFARGHPSIYPDPDVIVVDPSFLPLRRAQGAIYRDGRAPYGRKGRRGRTRASISFSATSRATLFTATSGMTAG
jgi:hypothetical protein